MHLNHAIKKTYSEISMTMSKRSLFQLLHLRHNPYRQLHQGQAGSTSKSRLCLYTQSTKQQCKHNFIMPDHDIRYNCQPHFSAASPQSIQQPDLQVSIIVSKMHDGIFSLSVFELSYLKCFFFLTVRTEPHPPGQGQIVYNGRNNISNCSGADILLGSI